MVSYWVSARSSADIEVRSLQWNSSSPVLIFPYGLPSPAFPITCLRTRPTSFCRECAGLGIGHWVLFPICHCVTLSKSYDFPGLLLP